MNIVSALEAGRPTLRQSVVLAGVAWLAMIGVDFFLHAGLLAALYSRPGPFLLPPLEAFRLIPLGYLAFFLLAVLLVWLLIRLRIAGWRAGLSFALQLGALAWGAFLLGLASIAAAPPLLLAGWFAGQVVELGVAGAVAGQALAGARLSRLLLLVIVLDVVCVIGAIVLQSLGLAPSVRL
jgi:hypothetical protein